MHEFPEDKWDAIIAVCLSSAFHTTKAALPHMLHQKWGRIINTGELPSQLRVLPLAALLTSNQTLSPQAF